MKCFHMVEEICLTTDGGLVNQWVDFIDLNIIDNLC